MPLINKAKVKEFANKRKINVAVEFYASLEEELNKIMEKACSRAKANFRTTLMKKDL